MNWITIPEAQARFPKHPLTNRGPARLLKVLDNPNSHRFCVLAEDRFDHDFSLLLFEDSSPGPIAIKTSLKTVADAEVFARQMVTGTTAQLASQTFVESDMSATVGNTIDRLMSDGLSETEAIASLCESIALLGRSPSPEQHRETVEANLRVWRARPRTS